MNVHKEYDGSGKKMKPSHEVGSSERDLLQDLGAGDRWERRVGWGGRVVRDPGFQSVCGF